MYVCMNAKTVYIYTLYNNDNEACGDEALEYRDNAEEMQ